jgi:IPT/TIG domain
MGHVWIAAALFMGNLLILGPWLLVDFTNQPWNNGYIYVAIARVFRDLNWTWNPLNYGGAPFHYLYPPIFHVLMDALPVASLGRAYHLLTGLAYALVPVSLYVLAFQLFGSRLLAAFAGIAYSLFPSPAYYFLPAWKTLAVPYAGAPWGFVALIGYDEAAHCFALIFALLAIAAAWRSRWTACLVLTAVVFLTSWPALLGLVIALIAVAAARTRDLGFVRSGVCVAQVAGTAYGLSAFWITPGYFVSSTLLNRVVLRHTLFAAPWSVITWLILLGAAALVGLSLWRPVPSRIALILAWLAVSGAVIISYTVVGNYLLPMPHRYMLEFNVGLVLAVAALISLAPKWHPVLVAAVMVAGGPAAVNFARHAWSVEPHAGNPRDGVGYQIAQWLNGNAGGARVMASGELDSTLFLWSDVPQVGGSGQDLSNPLVFAAERQVAYGCAADSEPIAGLWMRALNAPWLVVHSAASREYFHWFAQPEKFAVLPVAWNNGAGDTIYRVPDVGPGQAVVVDLGEMRGLPPLRSTDDRQFLEAYVRWAAGKRPASIRWTGTDAAELDADLGPDEAVLVKINNDPGWRANGSKTGSDPIGFLLTRERRIRFGASWDQWMGRAITGLTLILLFMRVSKTCIAAAALLPAVIAYAVLLSRVPPTVAVAEGAFIRLQPPIINPGGIVVAGGGIIFVYGLNFGLPADSVRVHVGNQLAEVTYHGPNLINFRLPPDTEQRPAVSIEVNGCQGNAFEVDLTSGSPRAPF